MDDFTLAYLECALWSSTDNADESGGEPKYQRVVEAELAYEALCEELRGAKECRW